MPKLYHPTLNSITFPDGDEIAKDKGGSFDVPEEHVGEAIAVFGFTDKVNKEPEQPQTHAPEPTLAEKLAKLKNKAQVIAFGFLHYDLELDEKDTREMLEAAILAKAAE